MPEIINPQEDGLTAESSRGQDEINSLPAKIERYSKARDHATAMHAYLRSQDEPLLSAALAMCGNWLVFHHYYTVGKLRLANACFCKKHLLCALCAIRRGSKQLNAYLERFLYIKSENQALRASMVTLTVKNGDDLRERFEHLQRGVKLLNQRRRNSKRGTQLKSQWAKVLGLVGTYEVTKKDKGWHPHTHILVLHEEEIYQNRLSEEWHQITGDSFICDVSPIENPDNPAKDFIEVFKYAVKFASMEPEDTYSAYVVLSHRRLIFSAGLFWGVKIPEDLRDQPLEDLPYFELFYKYLPGSGYNLVATDRDKARAKGRLYLEVRNAS